MRLYERRRPEVERSRSPNEQSGRLSIPTVTRIRDGSTHTYVRLPVRLCRSGMALWRSAPSDAVRRSQASMDGADTALVVSRIDAGNGR